MDRIEDFPFVLSEKGLWVELLLSRDLKKEMMMLLLLVLLELLSLSLLVEQELYEVVLVIFPEELKRRVLRGIDQKRCLWLQKKEDSDSNDGRSNEEKGV